MLYVDQKGHFQAILVITLIKSKNMTFAAKESRNHDLGLLPNCLLSSVPADGKAPIKRRMIVNDS